MYAQCRYKPSDGKGFRQAQLRAAAFPRSRYNLTVHQGSVMPVAEGAVAERLGDLPALLHTLDGFVPLVETLRAGRSGAVDGTWGSSAALAAAALALNSPSTILVVLAHPHDLPAWSDE